MKGDAAHRTAREFQWWVPLLLVASVAAVYANGLHAPFLFDDGRTILDNSDLRRWWPVWAPMLGTTRPLVLWSLAVNYALGGLDPFGYHMVNVAIHACASLSLYGVVRRTLQLPQTPLRYRQAAAPLAAVVAWLWAVHPLQTASVTYTIQRAESLMGLWYLLMLYCLVRGAQAPTGRPWPALAVLCCALGMASKPVMVTAPLMALAYDRIFLASSWKELIRRRAGLHAGFMATWVILAACVVGAPQDYGTTVGWHVPQVSVWRYAATQPGVILWYLRLALWPHPLSIDYQWPLATRISQVLWPGLLVGSGLLLTGWLLGQRNRLGFLGVWFFGILAPTSSLLPIADPIFEHRMYLSLAAVIMLGVLAVEHALHQGAPRMWRRRLGAGLAVSVTALLGLLTIHRNTAYAQVVPLWSDIVARQPENVRAHGNLGYTYETMGRVPEAVAEYHVVLRFAPADPTAHHNLGTALVKEGHLEEAISHFEAAVQLAPGYAVAHYRLGLALLMKGQVESAVDHLLEALRLSPAGAESMLEGMQAIAAGQGRVDEVITALQRRNAAGAPSSPPRPVKSND